MRRQTGFRVAGIGAIAFALLVLGTSATRSSAQDEPQAWLGVYTQTLTPELREGLGYDGEGALVSRVVPDSPAKRAGLEQGDVIVGINTTTVTTSAGLARAVRAAGVGKTISLRIVRNGERRTLSPKLLARPEVSEDEVFEFRAPEAPEVPEAPEAPEAHQVRRFKIQHDRDTDGDGGLVFEGLGPGLTMLGMGRGRLGVRVESLSADLGSYFGVKDGKGVLVLEVLKDTPAERAGLKAGDVITKVGDGAVYDADDLVKALRGEAKKVTLAVLHKGVSRTVESELSEPQGALRIRRDGPLGMKDGDVRVHVFGGPERGPEGGADVRREIEQLRREIRELRDRLKELDRN